MTNLNPQNKYTFEITETLQKQVEILAESEQEAAEKLKKAYENEQITLDAENFICTDFTLIDIEEPPKLPVEKMTIKDLLVEYMCNSSQVSFETYIKNRLNTDKTLIVIGMN